MPRRLGSFVVSRLLLAKLLCLPEGTDIRLIGDDMQTGGVKIVVEHESLPELHDGYAITPLDPQFTRDDNGPRFVSWNS